MILYIRVGFVLACIQKNETDRTLTQQEVQMRFLRREIVLEGSCKQTTCLMISTSVIHRFLCSKQFNGDIHKTFEQVFFIHQPVHHVTVVNNHIHFFVAGNVQQFRDIICIAMNVVQHDKRSRRLIAVICRELQSATIINTGSSHISINDFFSFTLQNFLGVNTITIAGTGLETGDTNCMQFRNILHPIRRIKKLGSFKTVIACTIIRCHFHPTNRSFISHPYNSSFRFLQILKIRTMFYRDWFLGKSGNNRKRTYYAK